MPSFDKPAFLRLLATRRIGRRHVELHERVPTTMTTATELIGSKGAEAADGALILAEEQTAGLGRRGRSWDAETHSSLLFSIVWAVAPDIALAIPRLAQLNLAAPVAVVRACSHVGVPNARIKWPNDVWAGSPPRKLSGVLVDFNGRDAAVLGVGINVLQDMHGNAAATSVGTLLREGPRGAGAASGAPEPPMPPAELRELMLASFCWELELLMGQTMADVIGEHRRHDLLHGRTVRVHHRTREESDPRDFDAMVLGVDQRGMLRVRPLGAEAEKVLSGEEVSISPQGLE
jgi:BirA family biotin operon repressor/biotin-[acetyl-CoA-carboxylase] ligase